MFSSNPPGLNEKARVLIVDDEQFIRDILADFLAMEGYSVRTASDGTAALRELRSQVFDVVVSDLKMPSMGGLDLLRAVRNAHPATLTIIMTGFGTVETAIDAMKRGAYDYVLKPFKAEEIVQVVRRAIEQKRLTAENLRLREAVSLYKVSEAISRSLSMDEVVDTITQAVLNDAQADWVQTWMEDGQGGFAVRQVGNSETVEIQGVELNVDVVQTTLRDQKPVLLDGDAARDHFVGRPEPDAQSLIIAPLKSRERVFGWVCMASFQQNRCFDEGQRKMLGMIASRAAAAIDNAQLYEDLQASFRQTIKSLARTIDKMDHYTAGHSERVARYAQRLARAAGLNEAEVEVVRQAALMHDIGKIGCVMNLNKPDQLTDAEYEAFKRHPTIGREILEPVEFLQPVIPGVHLHHERWDGAGYPMGLAGKSIPLIARIISIADTYDAMTSDRAYRQAMPHEFSVDEIGRCAGSQFDPDVAGLFEEGIDDWLDEWREAGDKVPE